MAKLVFSSLNAIITHFGKLLKKLYNADAEGEYQDKMTVWKNAFSD